MRNKVRKTNLPDVRVEYDGLRRQVRIYYDGRTITTTLDTGGVFMAINGVTTLILPDKIVEWGEPEPQATEEEFNEYRQRLQAKVAIGELF